MMANMVRNTKQDYQQRERFLRKQERKSDLLLTNYSIGRKKSSKSTGSKVNQKSTLQKKQKNQEVQKKDPEMVLNLMCLASLLQFMIMKVSMGTTDLKIFSLLALTGVVLWGLFYVCSRLPMDMLFQKEDEITPEVVERWSKFCRKFFLTESTISALLFLVLILIIC